MKRCLLDMDGVLVDFVGGACRQFGEPNPYLDPANHGRYELHEVLGYTKEFFFSFLTEAFWKFLEPDPECFAIVRVLEDHFGRDNVCICTSPVRTPGCYEGKLAWIRRHLPQFARRFLVGPAKEFAAGPDAWLVDDSDANVDRFAAWGGNVVHIPRPWNRLHTIKGTAVAAIERGLYSGGSI